MHKLHCKIVATLAPALALVGFAGCSSDHTAQDVAAMNKSNIQRLANLYSAYQNYKGGRGPANENEFRMFITNFDAEKLAMMGVKPDDLNALFTSERDGKPIKVRYNVGGGRGSVDAVAFEEVGKDGKRQVAFTGNTKVDEVDDATYRQLWSGKGGVEAVAAGPSRPVGPPPGAPTGPK
ncbi:MAG TPA: hypothetical protein VHR66_18230 [Gemmataceae bacterium]|jgi:hypothetical protein|nr:hypothetical protein [Gemmataceae bacterium]